MDVAIPESGQYVHAFGRNDFGIRRYLQHADRADCSDALVFDDNDTIRERVPAKTINQTTADQREWFCLRERN